MTAYDRYAIRAFEANALDYLLKPFSDERFEQALERARMRLGSKAPDEARDRVGQLESRLSPRDFTRIHRSAIVAIDRITRLEPRTHGEYTAVLADGTRLRVSRTCRAALEARLGQPL